MSTLKIVIVLFLLAIIGSLAVALFYLVTSKGKSKRMAKALTVRITLSVIVFIILMAAYASGLISPNMR